MLDILFGLVLLIFVGYILKIAFLAVVISGSGLEVVSFIIGFCVLAILFGFAFYTVKFADDAFAGKYGAAVQAAAERLGREDTI